MAVLNGLDNQISIQFEDVTSTPEFYTNIHSKIFDDTQYHYNGVEFNKLVSSTSINWQGAYMPNTAKYLNLDTIYLRNTSELLDIIERIALKIKSGKKVSDLTLKKVNMITASNNCKISVVVNVNGNVTFSIPAGTSIESDSLTINDNTVYLEKDVEYEFIITNNTSSNIDEIYGLVTAILVPDDEEYAQCTKSINVSINGIYIISFYWSNDYPITTEVGEVIIWPSLIVEKSNGVTEQLSSSEIILTGGYNQYTKGIYEVRAKYNDILTSNFITVTVNDTLNEITEIRIIGESNVVLEDTSIPKQIVYNVYTYNRYGTQLEDITSLVTLNTEGDASHTVSGNIITYRQEGTITIRTIYTTNGKSFDAEKTIIVSQEQKYLFGIATNTSDNYINASNYTGMQGVINYVSSIYEGEIIATITSGNYLYIVIPIGYNVEVTQPNSAFVINMFTHNGTKFVRNTDAIVDDTYKIYRSATLIYDNVAINITKES